MFPIFWEQVRDSGQQKHGANSKKRPGGENIRGDSQTKTLHTAFACWSVDTALDMLWKENRAKLVVMGAEGVGKTSILRRFLFDQFQHQHSPTVEEMFSRDFDINNGGLRLEKRLAHNGFQRKDTSISILLTKIQHHHDWAPPQAKQQRHINNYTILTKT